ncbi:MAG: hypothetical protein LC649_05850 [Bacteroidales bacterium]|nr:hypothetical protein [Bacteroidales bacterium]
MKRLTAFVISFLPLLLTGQTTFNQDYFGDLEFRNVGPTRGGRVTAVAGVESQPSCFYMGATGGGVWKTTDYGHTWYNISDGYFKSPSIGAIRVYQSNPDIVYVGTGSDGMRSNVIIGKGVYKSADAGETWEHVGLEKAGLIGAVEIDPNNPDRLFVAAIGNPFGDNPERGVFRSLDGGASWEKVLFISEKTGISDLEIHPGNPDIIYASAWTGRRKPWTIISGSEEGGVYRSLDGGDSWSKLTGDLPQGVVGKSDLAVTPALPDMVAVLVEAAEGAGLYISEDNGESFVLASDQANLLDRPFYYTNVDIDPTDPDVMYVNCTGYFKSTDRGRTWVRKSTPHGDNHDMWINPSDPNLFIQANDGGVNVTRDGGETWSSQMNQPTAELYQVDLDDQLPYWIYAGQQDNSTVAIPSTNTVSVRRPDTYIMSVGGCETGPVVPKPGNHNIVYANCKGRFGRYSKITRQEKQYYVGASNMYGHNPADLKYRFQRVSPIVVSPHDPGIVFHASQYLHRTSDEGVTWETISPDLTAFEPDKQVVSGSPITRDITGEEFYSTIYSVAESPLRKGVIWTGANDGPVYVTLDNGETWNNVTPADLPPGGRVETLEASPHKPGKAYIAVYRYLLDDWQPYIYRTDDYGRNWARLTDGTNGIDSDDPTRVVRESPDREGLLFAGTESGVFVSFNDGLNWSPFSFNLPVVPVTDIRLFRNDIILSTMGRSFWIMDNITPVIQSNMINEGPNNVLLRPAPAYRASWSRGAVIDYNLAADDSDVKITITAPDDIPVRVFATENYPGLTETEMVLARGNRVPESSRGFHRLVWDMRTYGPDMPEGRRGGSGPAVVPGRYSVTLETGGELFSASFDILPDPLVIADGVSFDDMREQYQLASSVRDLISKTAMLVASVEEAWKPLDEKQKTGARMRARERRSYPEIVSLKNALVTQDITYPQPMLADQVSYLYSMISRADQKPGKDAWIRFEELTKQYEQLKVRFDALNN